jgi:hypothetical protein
MITTDCPFCDQPIELDLVASNDLACDGCQVRVEIAADPAALVAAAA